MDRLLKVCTMNSQDKLDATKSNSAENTHPDNQNTAPKIIRQPNIFDATSWDVYYDENEIVSFMIQWFDCQTVEYNREQSKLYFSIDSKKADNVENYTSYGTGFSVIPNVIELTNEQNCQLLHILSQDYKELPSRQYGITNIISISLIFSNRSVATINTNSSGNSYYGNKLLFDLDSFLKKNFPKAPWCFNYSVSYLCPCCQKTFSKSYSDSICNAATSIICSNCNTNIIKDKVSLPDAIAQKKFSYVLQSPENDKVQNEEDTDEQDSPTLLQKVFRFFKKDSD